MRKLLKISMIFFGTMLLLTAALLVVFVHSLPDNTADCFVADRVVLLDTVTINNHHRIAVYRQTGFSDKLDFLELYADSAEFDACGTSVQKALWERPIEFPPCDSGHCVKGLQIMHDSLSIVCHIKDSNCVTALEEMKFLK